ncbi:MAG: type II toxin-antitoxin system prevent-host-death family antitoxin [Planctomycetia bacterium]|nr:type II toxin-antitoxin system prevent-host-death family antitoxin [Planctomycetia bacterium]
MATVTLREAQATLSDLIHRLTPGEEVVITENDQPVARLVPAAPSALPRRVPRLGTLRGTVLSMERFDDPIDDFKEYME